jgi:peptidoglycan/LPS O-acetylase OafA/YrhL
MEDRNRKMVLTALFGIIAVILALVAVYLGTGELSTDAVVWGAMIVVLLVALTAVKTGKKKEYNYAGAAIGGIMVAMGLIISALSYFSEGEVAGSGMITGGIILLVICLISLKKSPDKDIRDERSMKIGTWAISYSWYLTFLVVIIMFWLAYLDIVTISTVSALGILIMLMPLSTVAFQWYFSKKGDVY